ncbi:MAG: aminomethyl-transferring glycine dehydrogenase subunit GcvPB [Sporolactobacillus sp.]|jgi:glycine dehydrogenase subunit 2|nr:aminomethyl-transferring glycine dehydrogenase subunit GcvPB [Sporolactobacillus sp.]
MKLIFERSRKDLQNSILPALDVPTATLPEAAQRKKKLHLPEISEPEISRHYSELARRVYGVNSGFYPLGSCTMKYNPKINEKVAALPHFQNIHPLQPAETVQGCLEVLSLAETLLTKITGMNAFTFQPAAGAQGEFTGILMIKAYHQSQHDKKRNKIIIPDSAHGTNPATAAMAGYEVINVPTNSAGGMDIDRLKEAVGEDTAGLMLTNPNTLGIFDKNILQITKIIHQAGGLCYYDGANLNAVIGLVKPADMGFDVMHLNLHKTFSTPHGGGGPGAGAVGCKSFLKPFLPLYYQTKTASGYDFINPKQSIGSVKAFYGHFLIVVRALSYMLTLGKEGIPDIAHQAVLNANYMKKRLSEHYEMAYPGQCMHEFVMTLQKLKKETGVTALDVAKAMIDHNIYPPTMYFPLIVQEALMFEPTETESKETMDQVINVLNEIQVEAYRDPDKVKNAPIHAPVRRVDEVRAARHPVVRYHFTDEIM